MANRLTTLLRTRALGAAAKIAEIAIPNAKGGEARTLQTYRTEIYTYFTEVSQGQQLLYSAENWVRIKLTLETAGPVAIGTSAQIAPVLSGKGRLLDTAQEYEIYLARGTRVYVAAESVNRISVTIEPIPWMEQLSAEIVSVAAAVSAAAGAISMAIVKALGQMQSGDTVHQPPAARQPTPILPKALAPRLTPAAASRKTR